MNNNEYIKQKLDSIIDDMGQSKELYVKNPNKDFIRNRKLSFETVIKLILSMKGSSLNKELYDYFGKDPDTIMSISAFVQQRDKLKEDLFETLFHKFNDSILDFKTYKGYKLYAVDGSDINISYDKDSETYMKPSKKLKDGDLSKGYNQIHLNAIYDLLNKVYIDVELQPKPTFDERKAFINMLEKQEYTTKTLFIADRGYPSWNLFAHFKYKDNADYLIRFKNSQSLIVRDLPMVELDIDKTITITTDSSYRFNDKEGYIYIHTKKNKMKNREYTGNTDFSAWDFGKTEELKLRIVRFKITEDSYETIITSLPRDKFPISEIKKLYGMRWGIETSFRELKYVIGLTNLHAKKEEFVKQEIFAKLTMYNFCERIMSFAVVEKDNGRKHNYQINYTMAIQICLDFYRDLVDSLNVFKLMSKYILPIRLGRIDKRKKKPKSFISFTYRVA